MEVGAVYEVEFDFTRAATNVAPFVGDRASGNVTPPASAGLSGRCVGRFRATFLQMGIGRRGGGGDATLDNIRYRKVTREITGLGLEQITNGDFDADFSGWTDYTGPDKSIVDGVAVLYFEGNGGIYQDLPSSVGKPAIFTVRARNGGGPRAEISLYTSGGFSNLVVNAFRITDTSFGEYSFYVPAGAGIPRVYLRGADASTLEVDWVSYKEAPGIHGVQTTANDQSAYDWSEMCLDLAGTTQHLKYPNLGLSGETSLFALVKITADDQAMLFGNAASGHVGQYSSTSGTTRLSSDAGSPAYRINGANIEPLTNRIDLHSAIVVGEWLIVEVRGADMSDASWQSLRLSGWGASADYGIDGLVKASVVMDAPSVADRNQARQYLASLVDGLTVTDEVEP